MIEAVETAPALELTPEQIPDLLDGLQAYHAIYSPLFQRREQREHTRDYLQGLLLNIPRKSIEPIVLALKGADPNAVRALQQCISEGSWDDQAILQRHWQEVAALLGHDEAVLTLDGSDFLKQGRESVGVQRQYCGEVGKRANCQAGVFLGYATGKGYTLLDRRLYLPRQWLQEPAFQQRRRKCGVPTAIRFKTKLELGLEMIEAVRQAGTLGFRWLACDEAFGQNTAFLDAVAALGLWYFAEVPHTTRVWLKRPRTGVPTWSGRGRKPERARVLDGEPTVLTVAEVAARLPGQRWTRQVIKEGSKGPIEADFALLRVVAVRDELPGPWVWLVLRRNRETGELKTYLSNAPEQVSSARLVRISGMRWPIEQSFKESKQHLGMGHYEVRSWRGWHHHMTLVILAHAFLVRIQADLKKSAWAAGSADLAASVSVVGLSASEAVF